MQIHRPAWHRAIPQSAPIRASLIAFAVAATFVVPVSAQTPANQGAGGTRLLDVQPADEAQTSAAAAIAELASDAAGDDAAPAEAVAPAAEAPAEAAAPAAAAAPETPAAPAAAPAEGGAAPAAAAAAPAPAAGDGAAPAADNPLLAAITSVTSPADVHTNLTAAGYQVLVVGINPQNHYSMLVRKGEDPAGIVLVVDGSTGRILSHEATGAGGYVYPDGQRAPVYGGGGAYHPPAGYRPPARYNQPSGYRYRPRRGGYGGGY